MKHEYQTAICETDKIAETQLGPEWELKFLRDHLTRLIGAGQ